MHVIKQYKHYLSFGFNCEVSFALQHMALFESTTFSWADIRGTDALLKGINKFDAIFNNGAKRYGGNMFFCEETGVGFHGKLKFNDAVTENGEPDYVKITESFEELKSRINHLEIKQQSIFSDGSVLVVLKHFSDVFEEKYSPIKSVELIDRALQDKYGTSDFKILCITNLDNFSSKWDSDRYFFRYISNFSPRSNASAIDKRAWEELLSEFVDVKSEGNVSSEQLTMNYNVLKINSMTNLSNHESLIHRFHLDYPRSGNLFNSTQESFEVSGWVLLKTSIKTRVVVKYMGNLSFFNLNVDRPDVVSKVLLEKPENNSQLTCGFKFELLNMGEKLEIGLEINSDLFWFYEITYQEVYYADTSQNKDLGGVVPVMLARV